MGILHRLDERKLEKTKILTVDCSPSLIFCICSSLVCTRRMMIFVHLLVLLRVYFVALDIEEGDKNI